MNNKIIISNKVNELNNPLYFGKKLEDLNINLKFNPRIDDVPNEERRPTTVKNEIIEIKERNPCKPGKMINRPSLLLESLACEPMQKELDIKASNFNLFRDSIIFNENELAQLTE